MSRSRPSTASLARTLSRRMTRRAFSAALSASMMTVSSPGVSARTATPAATPVATETGDPTSTPTLHVSPTSVRFDERFNVRVEGVELGQAVTITAAFLNYDSRLTSEMTFIASESGFVDASWDQPEGGTWGAPDAMGLIWSAEGLLYYTANPEGIDLIAITALVDGTVVGETTIERSILPEHRGPEYILEDDIIATYHAPDPADSEPAPAVIVLGGSEGGQSYYADITAAVLASHGYATLALAYFNIGNLPSGLSEIPLEYFGNAIAWLQGQPSVDPERIGIVGASRGAEGALLVAAHYPEIKAAVSYVGTGYAHAEWVGPASDLSVSAWSWQGEPVRHLDSWEMTDGELREAEIPVERINGPVLLIGADADPIWSSSYLSSVAWDRLQRKGHPWPDQLLTYPGAGHGIALPPYMPLASIYSGELSGDPRSNAIAMTNAWPAVLQMLNTRLMYE